MTYIFPSPPDSLSALWNCVKQIIPFFHVRVPQILLGGSPQSIHISGPLAPGPYLLVIVPIKVCLSELNTLLLESYPSHFTDLKSQIQS